MRKIAFVLFCIALLLGACSAPKDTEKIIVASELGDCVGVVPMKCLLIKKEGQKDWEFFYDNIEGFNYEPGYEYILDVKVEKVENIAADRSSLKYTLIKQVSKEQKISEGLPSKES